MTALDLTAAKFDLAFTRGDEANIHFAFKDGNGVPVSSWDGNTFAAQLRRYEDDTTAVDFTVDASDIHAGLLTITLLPATTAALERSYAWDLQMSDTGGNVTTLLFGIATVKADVTR